MAREQRARQVEEAGSPVALGPYLLRHRLAKGGMGDVHLATHRGAAGIEKVCVVKTLRAGALEGPASVTRFLDEARVVVNLSHRNICSVFDVGCAGGRYYLAMEHVVGRDLKAVLVAARARRVALPPAVALHVMAEVLEALDYAHRFADPTSGRPLHLVHRDVSAANVMLSVEGEVKLIDFGLAWSTLKQQHTEPDLVIGKVAYMAPEQLAGETLDRRADVFAAGVLLYELLAGERFYGERKDGDIVNAAMSGRYLPPKLSILDEELQHILRRALAPARTKRCASAAVLKEALVRYAARRELRAGPHEVRALMHTLFPDERERVSALLSRAGAPCDSSDALPINFDTFEDFGEISEPSTPVGRVKLTKAPPAVVKPGTPRPELLERLGLPSGPHARAPSRGPSPPRGPAIPLPPETPPPEPEPRRRPTTALAAAAVLVVTLAALLLAFVWPSPSTSSSSVRSTSQSTSTSSSTPTAPER